MLLVLLSNSYKSFFTYVPIIGFTKFRVRFVNHNQPPNMSSLSTCQNLKSHPFCCCFSHGSAHGSNEFYGPIVSLEPIPVILYSLQAKVCDAGKCAPKPLLSSLYVSYRLIYNEIF